MSAPMEEKRDMEIQHINFTENESEDDTQGESVVKQCILVTEQGISVMAKPGKTPLEKSKVYNAKMKLIRELALCALHVETLQREETLHCLDAVAGTGITGLQWKKLLKRSVHVTLAEKDWFEDMQSNCDRNNISRQPLPLDFCRVPGDLMVRQDEGEIHTCRCAASVVLHMEAFDFVYLNPHGGLANHIDAAMSNHRNNGVLCVVSTDSTHQFTRSAHTVRRHFDAAVTKTDYLKELAVRVILATIVRAAAKCNKGIDVLVSVCIDDFFLIIVRVIRGPRSADHCIEQVKHVLHCQMCEERAFCPKTLSPTEEPYKLLSCVCKQNTPGRTGVMLGPVWSGNLFNTAFLTDMKRVISEEKIYSEKLDSLVSSLLVEAKCDRCQGHQLESTEDGLDTKNQNVEEPPTKRQKACCYSMTREIMPAFYYNVHRRKLKGINIPKYQKFLELLKQEGYRASRTHFDQNGIRTNASLTDVFEVLTKYCRQNTLKS